MGMASLRRAWCAYKIESDCLHVRHVIFFQVMKDAYLVTIILVITGMSLLLLFLWTVIPFLRGMAVKERDDENSFGETVRATCYLSNDCG